MVTTAGNARSAEYDAFGPWIDVITDRDDIPRLYRGFPFDLAAAELVLKVPRAISRKDATPSMDLYDHLIVVGAELLTVLSRNPGDDHGSGFDELTVGFEQLAIVEDGTNLLDGLLTIRTLSGESISFAYNGASEKVVARLVDLLRRREQAAIPALPPGARLPSLPSAPLPPLGLDDLGRKDAVLVTAFHDLAGREPGLRLLAAHGRRALAVSGGTLTTLSHLVKPAVLHGALLCATGTELQLLSRGVWIARGGAPVLSRARTIVPLAKLAEVTSRTHPVYQDVALLTLVVGGSSTEVVVPQASRLATVLLGLLPAPARF